MHFGVQLSTVDGPGRAVNAAVERGCEAVQIFSSNPRRGAALESGLGFAAAD